MDNREHLYALIRHLYDQCTLHEREKTELLQRNQHLTSKLFECQEDLQGLLQQREEWEVFAHERRAYEDQIAKYQFSESDFKQRISECFLEQASLCTAYDQVIIQKDDIINKLEECIVEMASAQDANILRESTQQVVRQDLKSETCDVTEEIMYEFLCNCFPTSLPCQSEHADVYHQTIDWLNQIAVIAQETGLKAAELLHYGDFIYSLGAFMGETLTNIGVLITAIGVRREFTSSQLSAMVGLLDDGGRTLKFYALHIYLLRTHLSMHDLTKTFTSSYIERMFKSNIQIFLRKLRETTRLFGEFGYQSCKLMVGGLLLQGYFVSKSSDDQLLLASQRLSPKIKFSQFSPKEVSPSKKCELILTASLNLPEKPQEAAYLEKTNGEAKILWEVFQNERKEGPLTILKKLSGVHFHEDPLVRLDLFVPSEPETEGRPVSEEHWCPDMTRLIDNQEALKRARDQSEIRALEDIKQQRVVLQHVNRIQKEWKLMKTKVELIEAQANQMSDKTAKTFDENKTLLLQNKNLVENQTRLKPNSELPEKCVLLDELRHLKAIIKAKNLEPLAQPDFWEINSQHNSRFKASQAANPPRKLFLVD